MSKTCKGDEACSTLETARITREAMDKGTLPAVSWEKIVEHIDHAVKVAGADHVGLGSDFDGATMPIGMEDASQLPKLTTALMAKGYSAADAEKILGGNILRVMEQVEQGAARDEVTAVAVRSGPSWGLRLGRGGVARHVRPEMAHRPRWASLPLASNTTASTDGLSPIGRRAFVPVRNSPDQIIVHPASQPTSARGMFSSASSGGNGPTSARIAPSPARRA